MEIITITFKPHNFHIGGFFFPHHQIFNNSDWLKLHTRSDIVFLAQKGNFISFLWYNYLEFHMDHHIQNLKHKIQNIKADQKYNNSGIYFTKSIKEDTVKKFSLYIHENES